MEVEKMEEVVEPLETDKKRIMIVITIAPRYIGEKNAGAKGTREDI